MQGGIEELEARRGPGLWVDGQVSGVVQSAGGEERPDDLPRYWTFSSDKMPITPPGYLAPTFCLARHVL